MTKKEAVEEVVKGARYRLLALLNPGDVVYTLLVSRARSGMSRRIRLFVARGDRIEDITVSVGLVLGRTIHWKGCGGIVIQGCGTDAGADTVGNLGCRLWPDGTDKPHGTRNGMPDTSGRYALKHQWL